MLSASLERSGIQFPPEVVLSRDLESANRDGRPILVAVTGTLQKQEKVREVACPGEVGSPVGLFEVFTRIDVTEINGTTGGDVARFKAEDFAHKLWSKLGGADQIHREAVVDNRIFLLCDTKMGIGVVGESFKPVHKLRTELGVASSLDPSGLVDLLPGWWVNRFEEISEGKDLVVRWSTGDAAVKFVKNKQSNLHEGDYVLGYADSKASVILPHRLISNVDFWDAYIMHGLRKRDGNISVHLGASMGILIEDVIEMLMNDPSWGVSAEDLNLLLPPIPKGMSREEYLNQHAKGAPKDCIETVLAWIVRQNAKGTQWLGTREAKIL